MSFPAAKLTRREKMIAYFCVSLKGFVNFIMREVQDHHAVLLDSSLRMVLKMLAQWKTLITMPESERKVKLE